VTNRIDVDGNEQRSFLDAPVIDCSFLPSKEALQYRLNQTIDLIEKGDRDFARWKGWKGLDRNSYDIEKGVRKMIDGEWYHVDIVRAIRKFMATWEARRAYLVDDIRDLKRSIELSK